MPVSGSSNGVNALGLVVFSMCFGLVVGNMKQQGQALRDFFDCLNEAIMRLVSIIIWSVKPHHQKLVISVSMQFQFLVFKTQCDSLFIKCAILVKFDLA